MSHPLSGLALVVIRDNSMTSFPPTTAMSLSRKKDKFEKNLNSIFRRTFHFRLTHTDKQLYSGIFRPINQGIICLV